MDDLIKLFTETFKVDSLDCPWGSCTEDFLLDRAIALLEESDVTANDKKNLSQLFYNNMYSNNGRFSTGKEAGRWYIDIIKRYYRQRGITVEKDVVD